MSDEWIRKVANKIKDAGDEELADRIFYQLDYTFEGVIKTVTSVKRTNPGAGSIVTIKVGG